MQSLLRDMLVVGSLRQHTNGLAGFCGQRLCIVHIEEQFRLPVAEGRL